MPSSIDLTNLSHSIELYSIATFGCIGLVTNIMNINVSSSKEIQKTTMGVYNIMMSILNILVIVVLGFLNFFPQSIGKKELILTSDLWCILLPYLTRVFNQMTSWLAVLISIDRVILVSYNKNSSQIKNTKQISIATLIILIILCLINTPGFFFILETQISIDPSTNRSINSTACNPLAPTIGLVRDLIGVLSRVILPMIITIITNIYLISKLLQLKINVRTLSLKREYKFTFTIVVLNCI